jgi:hypothetical protein
VGGVDVDNRRIFTELINENMLMKHIPGILAHSFEFASMKVRSKDELEILKRIKENEQVKEAIPTAKQEEKKGPVQVKPICLIMGYMLDIIDKKDLENEGIAKDLEQILRTVPSYFDIMLQQIMMLSQFYKMGRSPKRITARNIMTLIQFSQNLMQCGWVNKDPYAQLPYFDEEVCKKIKGLMNGKTLYQYCMLDQDARKQMAPSLFGSDYQKKYEE